MWASRTIKTCTNDIFAFFGDVMGHESSIATSEAVTLAHHPQQDSSSQLPWHPTSLVGDPQQEEQPHHHHQSVPPAPDQPMVWRMPPSAAPHPETMQQYIPPPAILSSPGFEPMHPPVAQPIATYTAPPMMSGHGYPPPVYPMFPPSLPMPPLMSPMFPLIPQPTYQPLMPREEPALSSTAPSAYDL